MIINCILTAEEEQQTQLILLIGYLILICVNPQAQLK